uniref:ER membrane protein complex subunit 7 beta-sandwich domain-containing protein n=1 Tax=Euplotes harpa TaxID=151035 RepID=A0A7S3J511_9SPIT|mmetsp:Transcript_20409/g.23573  ORF Transcript_20409/g.23573 Transcript_20409/m.23573 type:complete len:194 (-) Transcript_20409:23-604(-)
MKAVILAILIFSAVYATDVGGKLVLEMKKDQMQHKSIPKLDLSQVTVILEGEGMTYVSYLYSNGVVKFTNVPVGNYIMRIDDVNFFYDSFAIEVFKHKDKEVVRAFNYDIKNGKGGQIKHPVIFSPTIPKIYDEIKEPFSVLSLLKNPMVLMMLVSLGMVVLMNKMPKPDKEQMAEMNKQMGGFKMPSFLTPN